MAKEGQVQFARKLHEERGIEFDEAAYTALDNVTASDVIQVLLDEVESLPITEEISERIAAKLAELGPRRDGQEWEIPADQGRASAFERKVDYWLRGKRYDERKEAARAMLAEQGVTLVARAASTPVESDESTDSNDEIPF